MGWLNLVKIAVGPFLAKKRWLKKGIGGVRFWVDLFFIRSVLGVYLNRNKWICLAFF